MHLHRHAGLRSWVARPELRELIRATPRCRRDLSNRDLQAPRGGLARGNCRTGDGYILIDPDVGSLHEVGARLWLGPPKSPAAARRIDLPAFLAELLEEAMAGLNHDQVFVASRGGWLRRSHFARRVWRPACDGDPAPQGTQPPILPGAVFHGLRHHHKTVLDELDVPEVIKHERMGHRMKGIQGVYSHVTDTMRRRLVTRLQRRWHG